MSASETAAPGRRPLVVFTAISAGRDSLKPAPASPRVDCVAFLDDEGGDRAGWQVRPMERVSDDPGRNAKIHKVLAHRFFPEKEISLWLDGSIELALPMATDAWMSQALADCDLAVLRHSRRNCVYQEAQEILRQGLDDPAVVRAQVERYTREGYPANLGLSECCVLLRRHCPAVEDFNELWWQEIEKGSRRDQLSFDVVARRCGVRLGHLPGGYSKPGSLFRKHRHRDDPAPPLRRPRLRVLRKVSNRLAAPLVLPVVGALGGYAIRCELAGEPPPVSPTAVEPVPRRTWREADRPRGAAALVGTRRPVVAFGPERDYPSWRWVGFDTARELSKHCDVRIYGRRDEAPPECDVLFVVKERPAPRFFDAARRRGTPIVYCPIDLYQSPEHVASDASFLSACSRVLVHCERLEPAIREHCAATSFVEHHGRFTLPEMAGYREEGFVLWVGGCQYLAEFAEWLGRNPIATEIKALTDIDRAPWTRGARRFASLAYTSRRTWLAGCEVLPWSERRQAELLQTCKAAIDVKRLDCFNQAHKPPTKAQKYVASGVPTAVNPGSYPAEYFRTRGFEIASPDDPERWLSRAYWEETREVGRRLREETSLESVGRRFLEVVHALA